MQASTRPLGQGRRDQRGRDTRACSADRRGRERDRRVFASSQRQQISNLPRRTKTFFFCLFDNSSASGFAGRWSGVAQCLSLSRASPSPSTDDVAATVAPWTVCFLDAAGNTSMPAKVRFVKFSFRRVEARARGASATSPSGTPRRLPSRAAMARKRQGRIYSYRTGWSGPW